MKIAFRPHDRSRFDLQLAFALSFVGLGLYSAALVWFHAPGLQCRFRQVTGLPCPTCGATRAAECFLHLDFTAAVAFNPLVSAAAAAAVVFSLYVFAVRLSGLPRIAVSLSRQDRTWMAVVLGSALLANWAYLLVSGV